LFGIVWVVFGEGNIVGEKEINVGEECLMFDGMS
jgi:hypothetical protein